MDATAQLTSGDEGLVTAVALCICSKEICFISSPGNGLSCCCYQSEVRNPSPTWSGKWNEAADPNLNPNTYAGRGNGK